MDLLNEKVKVAEEEAQAHARKNFEATEEIRRVRATAVKVQFHCCYILWQGIALQYLNLNIIIIVEWRG